MVLTNTPATPTTTTPDTDNDTPPHTQPIRQFSFGNGTPKNHHHQPPPHAPVTYKECLKNHAANLGGHALDGCGEFMPSANASPNDPTSLTCAACGCHRNFHRRELDEYSPFVPSMTPHFVHFRQPRRSSSSSSPPPPPPPPQQPTVVPFPPASQILLSLSTAAQDDQQVPNNQYNFPTPLTPSDAKGAEQNSRGRKRFRTKFTKEQKEKMQSFAESMGWKMQRCDQTAVDNFCSEIGVTKGVLKVWMHNNKNTFGSKKDNRNNPSKTNTNTATATATATTDEKSSIGNNGGRVSGHGSGYNMNSSLNNDGDDDNKVANGNGSSPSS